jgi:hypothetical protein
LLKVVIKLAKKLAKIVKNLVKILKLVGKGGEGEEEGDL